MFLCACRRKVVESSIEIRELESKLKAAYVMKERHQQVIEKELYKSKEKVMPLLAQKLHEI